MKKLLIAVAITFLFTNLAEARKWTDYTEMTSPACSDIMALVDVSATSDANQKITFSNLTLGLLGCTTLAQLNTAMGITLLDTGTLTSGKYCTYDGTYLQCNSDISVPETLANITLTSPSVNGTGVNLAAGADLIGSSTSDITINTNKFTVAGATGNTVIAGTAILGDTTGSGATANTNADDLQVHHATEPGFSLLTADGGTARINFGDASDDNIGGIRYVHSTNSLVLWTNTADALTISSAKNVTLGNSLYLPEQADGDGGSAGLGEIWVKNDSPTTLWFTDSGDTDHQLAVGGTASLNYTTGSTGITLGDSDCTQGGAFIWSTATQDVDLPDCDAGLLGCRIQVLNDDNTEVTSVTTVAGDIISLIDGTALDAGDKANLDNIAHASGTFVCAAANNWYVTAQVGVITDGGAAE